MVPVPSKNLKTKIGNQFPQATNGHALLENKQLTLARQPRGEEFKD